MTPEQYTRARDLFEEALQRSPAEREPFLESVTVDDRILTEVRSLLNYHIEPETEKTESADNPGSTENVNPSGTSEAKGYLPRTGRSVGTHQLRDSSTVVAPGSSRSGRQLTKTAWLTVRRVWSIRPYLSSFLLGTLLSCLFLLTYGFYIEDRVWESVRTMREQELKAIHSVVRSELATRFTIPRQGMRVVLENPETRRLIDELVATADTTGPTPDQAAPDDLRRELRQRFARAIRVSPESLHFRIWRHGERVTLAASDQPAEEGRLTTPEEIGPIVDAIRGNSSIRFVIPPPDGTEAVRIHHIVPMRETTGSDLRGAIAVFSPEYDRKVFEALVKTRTETTGESYLFDSTGTLLSPSRFEGQLREIGLLPDDPDVSSAGRIEIRDPGVNLLEGEQPDRPLEARNLTKMASFAIAGEAGTDLAGYRDYRGVPVIGTWSWLPDHDVGLSTEINEREAYATASLLERLVFLGLGIYVLKLLIGGALILRSARKQHQQSDGVLGAYRLKQLLGEGGMARVYLADHRLLRRPTAIKLLKPEQLGPEGIARFKREVQLVSRLSHPNTVAVYDYGETDEGVQYIAMEYIAGVTLGDLLRWRNHLPVARAIHLLKQIAGSLTEAHIVGILHRDIKPQNIMLCERGGLLDVVKVVDFGLAKSFRSALDTETDADTSDFETRVVMGTPVYMAPERIRPGDPVTETSDVYSFCVVAYLLLTGREIFASSGPATIEDILRTEPRPIDEITPQPLPESLSETITAGLAKHPDNRPPNMRTVLDTLEDLAVSHPWTQTDAATAWLDHPLETITIPESAAQPR